MLRDTRGVIDGSALPQPLPVLSETIAMRSGTPTIAAYSDRGRPRGVAGSVALPRLDALAAVARWLLEDAAARGSAPSLLLAFPGAGACSGAGPRWAGTSSQVCISMTGPPARPPRPGTRAIAPAGLLGPPAAPPKAPAAGAGCARQYSRPGF